MGIKNVCPVNVRFRWKVCVYSPRPPAKLVVSGKTLSVDAKHFIFDEIYFADKRKSLGCGYLGARIVALH